MKTCGQLTGRDCKSTTFIQEFSGIGNGYEIYCKECFWHYKNKLEMVNKGKKNIVQIEIRRNEATERDIEINEIRKQVFHRWREKNKDYLSKKQKRYREKRKLQGK